MVEFVTSGSTKSREQVAYGDDMLVTMRTFTDAELYSRGTATLVASWEDYAQHETAAALVRSPGVAIAIFGHEPERAVYNNAVLETALGPVARADAIEAFHILVARLDGGNVATAMAFDWGSDSGIYNVATMEHARRGGLGAALTVAHLRDAIARECQTATLQSTKMAERMYASAGFRDLGRILEYVPPK